MLQRLCRSCPFIAICVLLMLCGCDGSGGTSLSGGKQANQAFLSGYDAARLRAVESIPLAIIAVEGDLIVVRRGVAGERHPVIDSVYTELKEVSHVILGVWLSVWDDDAEAAKMRSAVWLDRVDAVEAGLAKSAIPPVQRARQDRLLEAARDLIGMAAEGDGVTSDRLEEWSRSVKSDLMLNVFEAARAQLLSVNAGVRSIAGTMTPSERSSFIVVVCGVHQARQGNIEMQYFSKLLGPRGVEHERRLVFAESVFALDGAMRLLGAHQVDRSISDSFFGDTFRMQHDLLQDAASRILPELDMPDLRSPSGP
ncbi:MAG: hypothetical protein P8I74_04285 [Phycisphaerales bacterium]|nr:hypothetical protein [Phycisphaerales bacterium]